jgi:hypothetical protein
MSAASMALMVGIMMAVIFDMSDRKSLEAAHLRAITVLRVMEDSLGRNSEALSIGPASLGHPTRIVWTGERAALANTTLDRVRDVAD